MYLHPGRVAAVEPLGVDVRAEPPDHEEVRLRSQLQEQHHLGEGEGVSISISNNSAPPAPATPPALTLPRPL